MINQYFHEDEFRCKCCGKVFIHPELIRLLTEARVMAGVPFTLVSSYRCQDHNKAVNGVVGSSHTTGEAVDIRAVDSHTRFLILRALLLVGFNRIGVYKHFIHADVSKTKPREVVWYG